MTISVENLGHPAAGQRVFQASTQPPRVYAVREAPTQHFPAVPTHDGNPVETPSAHWDVVDVSTADLVGSGDW